MSKSIYDEVLDILLDSFTDPQDEDDDCYMLSLNQMNKISKAIRMAQKQEKLLTLYREKEKHEQEFPALNHIEYEDYQRIKTKILELENDK